MRHIPILLLCASCADEPKTCSYESDPVARDDASIVGFSVEAEERTIVGVWVGELTYQGGASFAVATPSAGVTRVEIEWVALPSEPRYVHGTAPPGAGRLACDSYLESDLELRLKTDDQM